MHFQTPCHGGFFQVGEALGRAAVLFGGLCPGPYQFFVVTNTQLTSTSIPLPFSSSGQRTPMKSTRREKGKSAVHPPGFSCVYPSLIESSIS